MSSVFEILHKDCAGRIGRLHTPHGVIETPTVLPVVNPNIQSIKACELQNFGTQALITNSYIIYRNKALREQALSHGLHALLDFSGPIMTDSGSFQLSVYGNVEVTSREIVEFQKAIGSDIGVPLDIPTPPDVTYVRAREELELTLSRLKEVAEAERGDMLLAAPIQGSTFPYLRTEAARRLCCMDFDVYPLGAVVPLMESYRYRELVEVIVASKMGLTPCAPVHLFGAGHPMMLALAVALGCDLFDSAAYALYARDRRYLSTLGTYHVEDLQYLPCSCPVCTSHTPGELKEERHLIAEHNLHVTFEEIRLIKQCIKQGRLWELVEQRCRAHPALLTGLKTAIKHAGWIESLDSASKSTFFYCGPESAGRPEVQRYSRRIERFELRGRVLIKEPHAVMEGIEGVEHVLDFKPPFGAYPALLRESHPFNAEIGERVDWEAVSTAIKNTIQLIKNNPHASFVFKKPSWLAREFVEELKIYADVIQ